MRLGIIGLPQSGKTTVFNALTRGHAPTGAMIGGGRFEVHTAVVTVPDPRIDALSEMFHPRKTIYAQVTYADVAGIESNPSARGELKGPLLAELRQMDGLLHVVRAFREETVPHPLGGVDPARDVTAMDSEILINDLITVERKLERLEDDLRKGGAKDKAQAQKDSELFRKLHAHLQEDKPLRELELSPEEERALSGMGLLTQKPMLILWNLGEGQKEPDAPASGRECATAGIQGKLEMEIAQMSPEEAEAFLKEYGIEEPGLHRVIRLSYDLLSNPSLRWARTKCAPGPCGGARWHLRPPAWCTPTCKKALSGPRWSRTTSSQPSAPWPRRGPRGSCAWKERSIRSRTEIFSTSASRIKPFFIMVRTRPPLRNDRRRVESEKSGLPPVFSPVRGMAAGFESPRGGASQIRRKRTHRLAQPMRSTKRHLGCSMMKRLPVIFDQDFFSSSVFSFSSSSSRRLFRNSRMAVPISLIRPTPKTSTTITNTSSNSPNPGLHIFRSSSIGRDPSSHPGLPRPITLWLFSRPPRP
jgi:ribosome-binding ATPase YchF (GTP1/OBG family)